jgi:MOSC domain-containing protein YiiM
VIKKGASGAGVRKPMLKHTKETAMQLISVNIGKEKMLGIKNKPASTGIFKESEQQPVQITPLGLVGDAVCDKKHHGGPDQAVYVYCAEDYAWWAQTLGHTLAPGTFGENLTISGLESASMVIGDRLHIGPVVLEVTAARIPCGTLAARMGDKGFVKRYKQAERPGVYCRVISEGVVEAGQPVRYEPYAGNTKVTVLEMFRNFYNPKTNAEDLRRVLDAPIAIRAREDYEAQLQKLEKAA